MEAKDTAITVTGTDVRGKLARGVDQAQAGAHEKITGAAEAAGPAIDRLASSAHDVVDRVAGVAAQAAETLGVRGEQLKTSQEKLVESAREYMRDHPVATISVAVAAGFVLSRLLSSR